MLYGRKTGLQVAHLGQVSWIWIESDWSLNLFLDIGRTTKDKHQFPTSDIGDKQAEYEPLFVEGKSAQFFTRTPLGMHLCRITLSRKLLPRPGK